MYELRGICPALYLSLDEEIDIGHILDEYKKNCLLEEIICPFVGMLEEDIEHTRCGVYHTASLFSNVHYYKWINEDGKGVLSVTCVNHRVTSVIKMYDDYWNDDVPLFVGVAHKLLKK